METKVKKRTESSSPRAKVNIEELKKVLEETLKKQKGEEKCE